MEEKILITVGRQIGSGGLQVAKMAAEKLGVEVYDKNLLMIAAKDCGIAPEFFDKRDEKTSALGRFARFIGLRGSVYADSKVYSDNGSLSGDDLFALQSKVIRELAERGSGVFVGRAADYVLRDCHNLMSVFITADHVDRITRVMEREGLSESEAEKFIADVDRSRSNYYNYYTSKIWGAAQNYDLCINSSILGWEGTANLISSIIRKKFNLLTLQA